MMTKRVRSGDSEGVRSKAKSCAVTLSGTLRIYDAYCIIGAKTGALVPNKALVLFLTKRVKVTHLLPLTYLLVS